MVIFMKKKIIAAFAAVMLMLMFAPTCFAKSNTLAFNSYYDANTNTVFVELCVQDPTALESADFCLAYDTAEYEYLDSDDSKVTPNAMIVSGQSILDKGLATCSLMFSESCGDGDLNEYGDLELVTFSFKPLKEDYDISDFCLWVTSYSVSGNDLTEKIEPVGKIALKEGHTVVVTASTTAPASSGDGINSKWYVYLIAGVIAVAAISGIAFIAIKNAHEEDSQQQEDSPDTENENDGENN